MDEQDLSDTITSHDNTRQVKHPRKIEYWYYLETKGILQSQIAKLERQISERDETIKSLARPVEITKARDEVIIPESQMAPIRGRKRITPSEIARMEAADRREYWNKEIARREAEVNKGNETEVISSAS